MWPQALQMTRDECRGVLRRIELESYSHVISVFRAQGGLTDTKAKLLEELRCIFHISQERHRAEARRVANDEQLSTIAEAISGPNTWQEWSREGRRSFPMLPRVAPQTALALIANSLASETAAENSKLPYPSETATAVADEHAAYAAAREAAVWDADRGGYVVTSDPFKMPDIPAAAVAKKNLKRVMPDGQGGSNKKRIPSETSPTKQQQQQQQKQYQHITASSNVSPNVSNIKKLYHNHTKLQQQRFFHQQQQQQMQKQKVATKKSAAATNATTTAKRQTTPAKCGRRVQKQQQKQQQLAEQTLLQQRGRNAAYVGNAVAANNSDLPQLDLQEESAQSALGMPQIAASKKDITKNLTKLQIHASSSSAVVPNMATRVTPLEHVSATSPTSALIIGNKSEKQLISTPVQKYIVEDRQPQSQLQVSSAPQIMTLPQLSVAATKLRAVNTTMLPPGTKLTAKKLPATTVVSPTAPTLLEHVGGVGASAGLSNTSQPQVFNIIEGGTTITTNAGLATSTTPTHTMPAVIQLHSSGNTDPTSSMQPTQSKVLTTKLLPMVLSGSGGGSATVMGAAASSNINKIETLNNGATIIAAGSGLSNSSGATVGTIIKSLPSSMLLTSQSGGATGSNSAGGTIISTLGSGASMFRKTPNIIKTNIIGVGPGGVLGGGATKIGSSFNSSNSGGPQIISNIKLKPATVNTTTTMGGTITSTHQQQHYLQQQLKNVSTTGIRTSVKICQSPNGKVFIQPANIDAAKAKLQGGLQHKLLSSALVGATGAGGGVGATTPTTARVAIQKVQIIPAPMSSPGGLTGSLQPQKTTTLTIAGNKSNMIFMPTTATRSATGTITLTKSAIGGAVGNIVAKAQQPHGADVSKTNVVVVGATTLPQTSQALSYKSATFIDSTHSKAMSTLSTAAGCSTGNNASTSSNNVSLESSQMITEDTPVDILNMPIIVDNNGSVSTSNIGDTVTVLSAGDFINASGTATQQLDAQLSPQPTVILGATDWEMELDQATAVAAARKARTQRRRASSNSARQRKSYSEPLQQQQQQQKTQSESGAILIDDCFEDVIVVEQDEGEQEQESEHEPEENEHMDERDVSNDDIIVLDEEKPKIVEFPTRAMQRKQSEDVPIEIMDDCEEQQENQTTFATFASAEPATTVVPAVECETDAGFDETIVTEVDENNAIEYIEEENSDSTADCHDMKVDMDTNQTTAAARHNAAGNGDNSAVHKLANATTKLNANSLSNAVNDAMCMENHNFLFAALDENSMDNDDFIESTAISAPAIDGNFSQDEQ